MSSNRFPRVNSVEENPAEEDNDDTSEIVSDKIKSDVFSSYLPSFCSGNDPLVRKLKLNDAEVDSLLDTGAMVNLISQRVMESQNWKFTNEYRELRGFNGSSQRVTKAITLKVSLGENIVEAKAYVLNSLLYDAIIGWPTLRELGLHLRFSDGQNLVCQVLEVRPKNMIYCKNDVSRLFPQQFTRMAGPSRVIKFSVRPHTPVVKEKPYRLSREKYVWAQGKIKELLQKVILHSCTILLQLRQ